MKKILAVASYGGHWKQLCRLNDLLESYDLTYVTTNKYEKNENKKIYYVNDANKDEKLNLIKLFLKSLIIYLKIRPDLVITTGAAPGLMMVLFSFIFRNKSIWIDSIANAEELSLSGKLAKKIATHTLSQWEELAIKEGVKYRGALIK